MNRPKTLPTFAANAAVAVGAWYGFYQGVAWVAWITTGVILLTTMAYLLVLASADSCVRAAARPLPLHEWIWNGFDVLIAAELLAASAWVAAGGWILGAMSHSLIRWRGAAPSRHRQA